MKASLSQTENKVLFSRIRKLVSIERRIGIQVLECLAEIDRRKAYAELRYDGLFTYCVRELRFTDAQAWQRIQAMRALSEMPELGARIESGELSVSTIAKAQNHFRKEQRVGRPVQKSDKLEVFKTLENKTCREVDSKLAEMRGEEVRERLVFELSPELKALWDETKNLMAHRSGGVDSEVLEILMREWLERNHPLRKEAAAKKKSMAAKGRKGRSRRPKSEKKHRNEGHEKTRNDDRNESQSKEGKNRRAEALSTKVDPSDSSRHTKTPNREPRTPNAELRRSIWIRDKGKCSRCGSKHALEVDHIIPYAHGGPTKLDNLRLLCRSCNGFFARKAFGAKARPYEGRSNRRP